MQSRLILLASILTLDCLGGGLSGANSHDADLQREALRQMVAEANDAAKALGLEERLPIVQSNLADCFVSPVWYVSTREGVGNIETKAFAYGFQDSNKLASIDFKSEFEKLRYYNRQSQQPVENLDINAACQMAAHFMRAFHLDVDRLNRDCKIEVTFSQTPAQRQAGTFAPMYYVQWFRVSDRALVAGTRFFLPTRTLLTIYVSKPEYNLRRPLEFPNLSKWLDEWKENLRRTRAKTGQERPDP